MKLSTIIIAVLAAVLVIIMLDTAGVSVTPFGILIFVIPFAFFAYLLILAKRYIDLKMLESNTNADFKTKIEMLIESIDRIEKKVDKIEKILEKVSE